MPTEAYIVQEGTGRLETLDARGFTSTELAPGVVLWFTPGTVHRAINTSGDLKVLILMQNAGLPEHGDAVMTFPAQHLGCGIVQSRRVPSLTGCRRRRCGRGGRRPPSA